MKHLKDIFKDKDGNYSLREMVTVLFVLVVIISWIADQFLGFEAPEYMFYGFISLVGAGLFGYSLEGRGRNPFFKRHKRQSSNNEESVEDTNN